MQHYLENGSRSGVSILTARNDERRNSDAFCRPGLLPTVHATIVVLLMCASSLSVNAADWQTNKEIASVAEKFAKDRYGKNDQRVAAVAGHLDKRIRLPRCEAELEPFVRPGTKVNSRMLIGVRCSGRRPWKIYVPVDVAVMQPILVAKKAFPRGHVLGPDDVVLENHDVSRLRGGYLSSVEELSGKRLKQQLIGGRVVTPAMLVAEMLVRRGQSVTLLVRNAQMNISMSGKALSDGALNQRIRVENINSQRVVEGVVRSPETVEILVHQ